MHTLLDWLIPWEFSLTAIIAFVLTAWFYCRGSLRVHPGLIRQVCFWSGWVLLYIMLQTHFDYYSQREFFMHRLQHAILHHLGPFLIMLSLPGSVLRAGLPFWVRTRVWKPLRKSGLYHFLFEFLLNPVVASIFFFGIVIFWLWPHVHFIAMLDWRWYRVMNWSVVVDGLLFWWLILDHRPSPPAKLTPMTRIVVSLVVALPQILMGAWITFSSINLYPIYQLCGRAFFSITAMQSQYIGGLLLWLPSAMMSALGALVVVYYLSRRSSRKS